VSPACPPWPDHSPEPGSITPRRTIRHLPTQQRDSAGQRNLIAATSGLAVQELNQPCFRTCKPLPLFARKRSEGVDQDLLSWDVHHVAGVDPATGTPGESDAPLEHGGLGRMNSVLVRADRRSAGGTDPTVPVGDRVPGPDLAPVLPPGRCSSSRHARHSLPQRVAQHSDPAKLEPEPTGSRGHFKPEQSLHQPRSGASSGRKSGASSGR
jgi:hypothetical protein